MNPISKEAGGDFTETVVEAKASPANAALIAEDDPIFRRILTSWFKKWDYGITAVDNGVDAWQALQLPDAPQLVILDWMMPGMDGIELCRRIRSAGQHPYRYVLLLTAKDQKHDVVAGLEAGADDYLTKPFDVDELHARIRAGRRILDLQSALIDAHDALKYESAHDPLTTVWNRGAIMGFLVGELERSRRSDGSLGVIMADIDHFKQVNDTYGHLVGDAVLKEASHRLSTTLRSYDSVGRYGGEEFLIIVPGCDTASLIVTAERLRAAIADRPVETSAGPVPVTLSLGVVAAHPKVEESTSAEALLRAADEALYAAKAHGRNRVEVALKPQAAGQGTD